MSKDNDLDLYENILKYQGTSDKNFNMSYGYMEGCRIGVKKLMAENGQFLNFLYQDGSKDVRCLVARQCYELETLKKDNSWEVRLEVYNQTNFEFMEFEKIENEHPMIKAKSVLDGNMDVRDFIEDYETSKLLLNNNSLSYKWLEYIFNKTSFRDLKIKAVMEGFVSTDMDKYKSQILELLNDIKFAEYCILENKYIDLVIEKYKDSEDIVFKLLEKGYGSQYVLLKSENHVSEIKLYKYAFEYINSVRIREVLIYLGFCHVEIAKYDNNVNIIERLTSLTSSADVLNIIANRCNKDMSEYAKSKLRDIENENEDLAKIFQFSPKVKSL